MAVTNFYLQYMENRRKEPGYIDACRGYQERYGHWPDMMQYRCRDPELFKYYLELAMENGVPVEAYVGRAREFGKLW